MGRTIPSFRIASKMEFKEWNNFRRALPKADRKLFDNMFFISVLYNSACVCCANPIRIQPILMSILFQHYKELSKISKYLETNKEITDSNKNRWTSKSP
jgi:hypothetical protein